MIGRDDTVGNQTPGAFGGEADTARSSTVSYLWFSFCARSALSAASPHAGNG